MTGPTSAFIDLSYAIADGGPSYPGDPGCSVTPYSTIPASVANVSTLTMGSHQATHLDAPFHFFVDGAPVDEIPLEQTTGPTTLVDVSHRGARELIEVGDFAGLDLRAGDRLVYRTRWDRVRPDPSFFTDGPRLSVEAALWLAGHRLALVGMDTGTPNPVAAVEVHQALLGAGTVIIEGLVHLDRLRPGAFWLYAAPMLIAGSDGAPVRAYARQDP